MFASFLLTIGYAMFANSKTIRVDGTIVSSFKEDSTSYGGTTTGIDSTERLPACAGRISDVVFQVLKYDVFGDGAVGG